MNIVLVVCVSFALSGMSLCGASLQVIAIDAAGKEVSGQVEMTLVDEGGKTLFGPVNDREFVGVSEGSYVLVVRRTGFSNARRRIEVKSGRNLVIAGMRLGIQGGVCLDCCPAVRLMSSGVGASRIRPEFVILRNLIFDESRTVVNPKPEELLVDIPVGPYAILVKWSDGVISLQTVQISGARINVTLSKD